jgi:hypothetical protein
MGDHWLIFDIVDQNWELPHSADGERLATPTIIREKHQVCFAVRGALQENPPTLPAASVKRAPPLDMR